MIVLLVSATISLVFALVATPLYVRLAKRLGWGQFIRADGPQSHHTKRGTPQMGGLVFIVATIVGYFGGKVVGSLDGVPNYPSAPAMLVLLLMVGLGAVGFVDDFLKVRKQQSLGLGGWAKVAGQVAVGIAFALLALHLPDQYGQTPASTAISAVRDIDWLDLSRLGLIAGTGLLVLWFVFIIVATSNAVNVLDGLDGLATGSTILSASAFVLIGFWQNGQACLGGALDAVVPGGAVDADLYRCYPVQAPLDLAVVAACLAGALIGFLWYNTSPAQLFMGDVGSLSLGGALAGLAIMTHTQLLLVLVAALPLIVTGSVIIQRIYFKATKGRRIFLMTPLHHHFELKGWADVRIVVRFWIVSGLFVAAAVGLFYLDWVIHPGQ